MSTITLPANGAVGESRIDYGPSPYLRLLLWIVAAIIWHPLLFALFSGGAIFPIIFLDMLLVLKLIEHGAGTIRHLSRRTRLKRSGLDPELVLPGANGDFIAIDTRSGRLFAGGYLFDLGALNSTQVLSTRTKGYLDLRFTRGPHALVRVLQANEFQAEDNARTILGLT